ncbi:MAG: hypothetical protein K9W42_14175 [Candidatus Heimdallarchaeota archaeon]|nr:hypothetical protein [Candidatus Heimdallarchaeota archaeon]
MTHKNKLFTISFSFLVLLIVSASFVRAASPGWGVGEIYSWGTRETIYEVKDGLKTQVESVSEFDLNITAIDTLSYRYDAYLTDTGGRHFLHNVHYGAEDYVSSSLVLSNFISVDYSWDYVHNRTVLTSVIFNLEYRNLLEPNWALINKGFRDMLNGSEVIETENDPYSSTVYNFTLLDVFNSLHATINGKHSFTKGWNSFIDSRTKWTFSFDLSGVYYRGESNGSMIIYYPYEKALYSVELEYTNGGILKSYLITTEVKYSTESTSYESNYEYKKVLGGYKSAQVNLALFPIIATLGLFAIGVLLKKHKKK